jgi:HD-like signal output (HDOD) protein
MGHLLTVGMACPLDKAAIAELEKMTGLHVKAMLCQMDDIVKVIRRYYPEIHEYDEKLLSKAPEVVKPLHEKRPQSPLHIIRPRLSDVEVIERLEQLDFLTPYPGTIDHLLSATEDPNRTLRDIAGIAGTDPATTAYFISVANCVPYGFTGKVTNANTAALLLGVPGAAALARALREAPPLPGQATFDYHDFWVRSVYCAAAAMAICKATGGDRLADAYTAGLLHDIGRLALAAIGVEDAAAPGGLIGEIAEPSASGHPEAGYALAKHWRLPAPIDTAIRHHHRPNLIAENDTIAKIVAVAALMSEAHARKENIEPHLSENYAHLMNQIGLTTAAALDIFTRVGSTLEPAATQ